MAFVPDSRVINTTSPLTGGGALTADLTLAIPQATVGQSGYLASADFATFNSKMDVAAGVPVGRLVNTTAPITGGGALSGNLTLAMAKATASVDGYLAAADFTIFAAKQAALGYTAEDQANKVTAFSSPTNAQYPSALLVSNQLALKIDVTALSAVTNDVQTKAAIVPNTVPVDGQMFIGSGGVYVPRTLSGGATISTTGVVTLVVPDASSTVKGLVKLSIDPAVPTAPIAWGQNDTTVEVTTNKVTALSSPTNVQYPSALLLQTQLGLKIDKQTAITPATQTKITYNADGVITSGAAATTADIADSVDKRYVSDARLVAVNLLSGTNTGDQNLVPYALAADLATTNANITALSNSLNNLALATDLGTVNTNLNALSSSILANNEAKLTFSSGLTRVGNIITNDALTVSVAGHRFLGNNTGIGAIPAFVQPGVADLSDGVTGTGQIVLKTNAALVTPSVTGPLPVVVTDALNTQITTIASLSHDLSGGTAAVGMGSALDLLVQSTSQPDRLAARLAAVWTDATDGTRTAKFQIQTTFAGSFPGVIPFTISAQGGLSIGDGTYNATTGIINAAQGFVVGSFAPAAGNYLRSDGTKFTGNPIASADLHRKGVVEGIAKLTTAIDQTTPVEVTHWTYTVPANEASQGTMFRITAWGNMDNGTTAVTYTPRIRWGGLSGVILMATPTVIGTTTAQTNKTWFLEAMVLIATVTTARAEMSVLDHTTSAAGAITQQEDNSGSTGIVIDGTVNKDLVLTWTLSTNVGAPHVRTFGASIELFG